MHEILQFIRSLTDPDQLIYLLTTGLNGWAGYLVLFAVVFAESGLLIGFFLPGDSLLFTVGIVAGAGKIQVGAIIAMLAVASILGDGIGFFLGNTVGYALFKNSKSRFFRREYLDRTHAFYEKHGGKTIIYAKFVPIIRTFAAFIAGVGKMQYGLFLTFNVVGAVGWGTSMVTLGYLLGNIPWIRHNFEKVVLLIIALSILPVLIQLFAGKKSLEAVR